MTLEQYLQPLAYHVELGDYLRAEEPALMQWFASDEAKADYAESVRLDLLKSTFRLDREEHADLYAEADMAREALGLEVRITLYQSQVTVGSSAAVLMLPGEAHIVLIGELVNLLTPMELRAVLGHELAHQKLFSLDGGAVRLADNAIHAMAMDPRGAPSHVQSARYYQLYTEIYADRGGVLVTGEPMTAISALLKVCTGMKRISAPSYLRQADEIFANRQVKAMETSHPEAFIRARALYLWSRQHAALWRVPATATVTATAKASAETTPATPGDSEPAGLPEIGPVLSAGEVEAEIRRMIEGEPTLDDMDLLGQRRWTAVTHRVVAHLLSPSWMQSAAIRLHAKLFSDTLMPAAMNDVELAELAAVLSQTDDKLRGYIAYVLLDFAACDAALADAPQAWAMLVADALGVRQAFEDGMNKEMKVTKKRLAELRKQAAKIVADAAAADGLADDGGVANE